MAQILIFILLLSSGTLLISGERCSTLDGTWYNELGSMMTIRQTGDGEIIGEYRTAVERVEGAKGGNYSSVIGAAPYSKPGAAFGFSVMWRNGASMTSWTGQCLVCGDGLEVLETSWILKMKVNTCGDIWQSTLIGQDSFTRSENDAKSRRRKRETREVRLRRETQEFLNDTKTATTTACSTLSGSWYNQVGSEMIINTHHDNDVRGEYRTAVEGCPGASGSGHSQVFGVSNSADPSSTVALYVVWNNGESVTTWAGQCHVCGADGVETLVLTWLLRTKVDSCHDNWLATNYGEAVFTRHEHKGALSGGHTARESGENSPRDSVCSGAILNLRISLLISSFLLAIYIYLLP